MSKPIPLWKLELLERIANMTNDELFDNMLDAQRPDDFGGTFTNRGAEERFIYIRAVRDRLRLSGWLKNE